MAVRYYKGTRVETTAGSGIYKLNMPADVIAKAIDVTRDNIYICKADVTDLQHNDIIALGNTEILKENVITEIKNLFGSLYSDNEIIKWRDTF